MDMYDSNLKTLIINSVFNYEQKLEITIKIAEGLLSIHSGDFKFSHNDL